MLFVGEPFDAIPTVTVSEVTKIITSISAKSSPYYSTETALLHTLVSIYRSSEQGRPSLLVSLDLSAAFDTIDHHLLDRLNESFGVSGTAHSWLRSYLSNRHQSVRAGGPVWISTYSLSHRSTTGLSAWPPSVHVLHLTYPLNCFVVRRQHSAVCGWHSNLHRFNNCRCNRTFNSSLLLFVCST